MILVCVLQDGSLFPIASLLETGTSNLGRVTVIWEPITKHLIEVLCVCVVVVVGGGGGWHNKMYSLSPSLALFLQVCSHGDLTVRSFGADFLSHLIRSALEQETQEVQCVWVWGCVRMPLSD